MKSLQSRYIPNIVLKRHHRDLIAKRKKAKRRIVRIARGASIHGIPPTPHRKRKFLVKFSRNQEFKPKNKFISKSVEYLVRTNRSPFLTSNHFQFQKKSNLTVPTNLCLIDNHIETIGFINDILNVLKFPENRRLVLDYSQTKHIDLATQMVQDIIMMDYCDYYETLRIVSKAKVLKAIQGINIWNREVQKLLFSVGSRSQLIEPMEFHDIIPYHLTKYDVNEEYVQTKVDRNGLDTTSLVEYVQKCYQRLNKPLSNQTLKDLGTVVGEILINAEEHSTHRTRYSVGLFHEKKEDGKTYGVFRLAILNFGQTIYEKFRDPLCPNKTVVQDMNNLSQHFREKSFFIENVFEEEQLWTLYALQENVTAKVQGPTDSSRGNGSMQFIKCFFNIKGRDRPSDPISRMVLVSGNTSITFDGTYHDKTIPQQNGQKTVMTFNKSGKIEEAHDTKFVRNQGYYFPGTFISIELVIDHDNMEIPS